MAGYKVYQANVNVFRCFIHVLLFDHIIKSCDGITTTTSTNTPARLTFKGNCSNTTQCLSTLVCLDSGHCGCDSDYYKTENETCEPRLTFKGNCSNTTQCLSTLVCLDSGHCGCDSDYYETENETCEPKVGYNQPCENKECLSNLVCDPTGKICGCASDQFYNSTSQQCAAKTGYQEGCQNTFECLSNLICSSTTLGQCVCNSDQFYNSTSQQCAAKLSYGADCSAHTLDSNVCKVTNTQCLKAQNLNRYFCLCDSNYYKKTDNTCGKVEDLKVVLASYPTTTSTVDFTWTTPNVMADAFYSIELTPREGTVDAANANGGKVSGLTSGKKYSVNIVSKLQSDTFYSERTANVGLEIWMKPAKPGEVASVTFQNETTPFYTIEFGRSYGIVASYKITVNGESQTSSSPSARFNTLKAGRSYDYSIVAFNGEDPPESSEKRTGTLRTSAREAGAVSNLSVTNVASHTAQVEWKMSEKPNGNITGYQIILKRQDECVASYQVHCSDCGEVNFTVPPGCTFKDKKEYSYGYFENPKKTFTFDLSELKPYINYRVIVSAISEEGAGKKEMKDFRTLAAAPFDIENVVVEPTDRHPNNGVGLKISWTPGNFTGPTTYNILIEEQISLGGTDYNLTDEIHVSGYENTTYTKYGLLAYWKYTVSIMAKTTENDKIVGESKFSTAAMVTTSTDVPGLVQNFDIQQDSIIAEKLKLAISCPPERQRNGKIEGYTIRKTQNSISSEYNVSITSCLQESVYTEKDVGGIFVETNYSFEVKVRNSDYIGNYSQSEMLNVEPKGPSLATRYPGRKLIQSPVESTKREAKIDISICASCLIDKSQGTVKGVGLRVCVTEDDTSCIGAGQKNKRTAAIDSLESDSTWAEAKDEGFVSQYRATPTNWHKILPNKPDYLYTVGNNETCGSAVGDYCNGPLPAGKKFLISVVVCNEAGCDDADGVFVTKASSDDPNTAAIIGAVVAVVAALVIVGIIVFILWRRRSHGKSTHRASNPLWDLDPIKGKEHILQKRPVKLCNFKDHVTKLHKDSNLLFQDEFEDIKKLSERFNHTCDEAKKEGNRVKNRYVDILPYDHSRTKLETQPEDDDTMDFINANYIGGLNSVREYIASQGPMHCTMPDFWRMVWEQKSKVIVMLSDLQENGKRKVDLYWPENLNEPINYGNVTVEMTNFSQLNKYIIRNFKISKGEEFRKVTHFFLPGWWDFSANLTVDDVLEFAKLVRQEATPANTGPIVVHCSAGVGRTGTFIALDYFMQHVDRLSLEDEIDIFSFVMAMRKNRPRMVQAETQYIFIFDALNEIIQKKIKLEEEHMYANGPSQNQNEGDLYANMGKQEQPEENLYANTGAATVSYDNKAFEPDYDTSSEKDEKKDTPTTVL